MLVLATAATATAQTAGAPRLASAPFLGKISGGAAVNYSFDRTPGKQAVTIAGQAATVHLVGTRPQHEYNATVHQAGLRAGRSYTVVITALARNGKAKLTFRKQLFMHRSLNRPQ